MVGGVGGEVYQLIAVHAPLVFIPSLDAHIPHNSTICKHAAPQSLKMISLRKLDPWSWLAGTNIKCFIGCMRLIVDVLVQ